MHFSLTWIHHSFETTLHYIVPKSSAILTKTSTLGNVQPTFRVYMCSYMYVFACVHIHCIYFFYHSDVYPKNKKGTG